MKAMKAIFKENDTRIQFRLLKSKTSGLRMFFQI